MSETNSTPPEVEGHNASTSEAKSAVPTRPIAERLHALVVVCYYLFCLYEMMLTFQRTRQ
jgi:hypothetical protein